MGKTLKEKLEQLSPERRKKIEQESNLLIAEEMTPQQLTLFYHFGKRKINVGWVERSETQQYRGFWVLGFL